MRTKESQGLQAFLIAHPAPSDPAKIGEYLLRTIEEFETSNAYRIVFGHGDEDLLELSTVACSALGTFVLELLENLRAPKADIAGIERVLKKVYFVMEALAQSSNADIVNALFVGTFEHILSTEKDWQFQDAYDRLHPLSRKEWDTWMPLNSTRPYKPKNRK